MRRVLEVLAVIVLVTLGNFAGFVLLARSGASAGPPHCVPGDVNGDGAVDVSDPIALLEFLFNGGPTPVACASTPALTPEQEEILSHMSIVYLDDGQGGTNKTIRFTGVNVQIVNGLGATNGNPLNPLAEDPTQTAVNGLGNLFVGYRENNLHVASGSHNIVLGIQSSYHSFSGLVGGVENTLEAPFGVVLTGEGNRIVGTQAVIANGFENLVDEFGFAALGSFNWVAGQGSGIIGGSEAQTTGLGALVLGGGPELRATGDHSVAIGGYATTAVGAESVAIGGYESVAGGGRSVAIGGYASGSGGGESVAIGGWDTRAPGANSVAVGGFYTTAAGFASLAAGGLGLGPGGPSQRASGDYSTVIGGKYNQADGETSVCVGGEGNVAVGASSSVGGGFQRSAAGPHDWVAGSLSEDF